MFLTNVDDDLIKLVITTIELQFIFGELFFLGKRKTIYTQIHVLYIT